MCRFGGGQLTPGHRNLLSGGGAFVVAFVEPLFGVAETLLGVVPDLVEPARDLDRSLRHAGGDGRGEGAALRHGGDVGTVGEQNAFDTLHASARS